MSQIRKEFQNKDYARVNIVRRLKHESFARRRSIFRLSLKIIVLAAGIELCVGPFGSIELLRMYQKKQLLSEKLLRLSTELSNLELEAMQLNNPLVIERLARERYWMKKPGEIIIKLPTNLLQSHDPS